MYMKLEPKKATSIYYFFLFCYEISEKIERTPNFGHLHVFFSF